MKQYTFYRITLISLPEYTYIGYTTNFNNRKYSHKNSLKDKNKINHPLYKTINDNGGWDNVSMNILEYGEYENLKDVYIRERELIDLHKSLMNCHLPSKIDINYSENPKEYKQKWRQEVKEKYKEKYIQNKEKISTKGKEKVICDICNKEYCRSSLWHHKQTHKNK
jgi:hypothetical protein